MNIPGRRHGPQRDHRGDRGQGDSDEYEREPKPEPPDERSAGSSRHRPERVGDLLARAAPRGGLAA